MAPKILFVYTSASKNLVGGPTGWFLPEAAHPYYTLAPKYPIDFASPAGPHPPVDPTSVESFKDEESVKFLSDPVVQEKFATAKRIADVNADDYDAIFYVGGHGPVIDLAKDADNIKLAGEFAKASKIVSAVCHGPAALVDVKGADGKSIFDGKEFTGFSNFEEEQVHAVKSIPFLLEDEITKRGGKYTKAAEAWAPKVVVSGKLITGQNPASAKPIGEELDKALAAL